MANFFQKLFKPQGPAQIIVDTVQLRRLAFQGKLEELEALLKNADREQINDKDNIGHSAIIHAIGSEQVKVVAMLLSYGADPNSRDLKNITPLAFVAEPQPIKNPSAEKRLAIAKLLLKHGADVSIDDYYNNQPLFNAVQHGSGHEDRLPLVSILMEHGADPNRKNKSGISPLSFAQKIGWQPMIDILEKQ